MCALENALAHQACVLRSDLEKALRENASLYMKIGKWAEFVDHIFLAKFNLLSAFGYCYTGREDKLSSDNRSVVNNYQFELSQQISSLKNFVENSLCCQKGHIQSVENLCQSFLDTHDKVVQN